MRRIRLLVGKEVDPKDKGGGREGGRDGRESKNVGGKEEQKKRGLRIQEKEANGGRWMPSIYVLCHSRSVLLPPPLFFSLSKWEVRE